MVEECWVVWFRLVARPCQLSGWIPGRAFPTPAAAWAHVRQARRDHKAWVRSRLFKPAGADGRPVPADPPPEFVVLPMSERPTVARPAPGRDVGGEGG